MINTRMLGYLLSTLDGVGAGLGPLPAARVSAVTPTVAVGNRLDPAAGLVAALSAEEVVAGAQQGVAKNSAALGGDESATRATARPQQPAIGAASPGVVRTSAGATIALQTQSLSDASAPLQLSDAARLVDQLVKGSSDAAASTIRGTQPLGGNGTPIPEALAHALQSLVAQSGLFYESHLAQWALQQYPMSDLANEPQAALQPSAASAQSLDAATGALSGDSLVASLPGGSQAAAALPLVRHQLDTLETRQVAWEGQVWPGQPAQIQIAEDEAGPGAQHQPTWRTRLALDLPTLGQVEATLSLRANTLQLRLHVIVPESASLLRATQHDLVDALDRRALSLVGFAIDHE